MASHANSSPVSSASAVASGAVRPVWFDCDPGHDDALALILAGYSPALRLVGVSTVGGNQSLEKTTNNALNILHVAGLLSSGSGHLAVHAGREHPLLKAGVQCAEIHGTSGLEGTLFPPLGTLKASPLRALDAMRAAIETHAAKNDPITLIATGPLTNVAVLLLACPEYCGPQSSKFIREIVLMGGSVGLGNTSPAAEFNIEVDPHAARIVFESGIKVTMVPLEVTHTALVTPTVLERIRAIGAPNSGFAPSAFPAFICDLLLFFRASYATVFGFPSPPLHDPCAVAFLLAPEMFVTSLMRVDVECESALCSGRTVCDVYGRSTNKPKNVHVALRMDVDKFWTLMINALAQASKHSCLNRIQPAAAAAATAIAEAITEETKSETPAIGFLAGSVQNLPAACFATPSATSAPTSASTSSAASSSSSSAVPSSVDLALLDLDDYSMLAGLYPGLSVVPSSTLPGWLLGLLPRSKFDLGRAEGLVALGMPAVEPVLPHILTWVQDVNWPVASIIVPFLASIGSPLLPPIRHVLNQRPLDGMWVYWIVTQVLQRTKDAAMLEALRPEIEELAAFKPSEDEVDVAAKELLEKMAANKALAGAIAPLED